MILKELMRENLEVFKLKVDSHLYQAAELMREKSVGSVVIVDDNEKVIGILTDRDIALTLALGAGTPNSYVTEAMTRDVETIPDSMRLFDVTRLFRTVCVKRLPVVDSKGRLVGIISVDDVLAQLSREMLDTCSAMESKLGHMV